MQTFLPYPSFTLTASHLDWRRLGKQRVEAWQILNVLTGQKSGWSRHPAVLQWAGHHDWLCTYAIVICDEWIRRGYNDTMRPRFCEAARNFVPTFWPTWLGRADYHASHRANLLRKDFAYYSQHGWAESPDLPYVWPVRAA